MQFSFWGEVMKCPKCGEEKKSIKLEGTAQILKDIVDKYGVEVFANKTRCKALFSDLVTDKKDQILLGLLLESGFVNRVIEQFGKYLSPVDSEKLCCNIAKENYNDSFSQESFSKAANWYFSSILGIEANLNNIQPAKTVVIEKNSRSDKCNPKQHYRRRSRSFI